MDELQIPAQQQNLPPPPVEKKEATTPYVFEGLIIGVVLAVTIIGGMFYKSQLSAKMALESKIAKQVADQKAKEQQAELVVQQTSQTGQTTVLPTVAPVVVTTEKDLATQQTALDNLDLSEVMNGLNQNMVDYSDFTIL